MIDLVIGTRPNIVKAGPLLACLRDVDWCRPRLVFLAQHTLGPMTTQTLEDVQIALPEVHRIDLEAGDMGHRMGEMIGKYAAHLDSSPPQLVLVFGDVDSTFAATYAAKRMQIPVAHVEAGLRSGDLTMPEELNRRMVDSVCDLLFTTTHSATENLLREGRSADSITFAGNLMIDALKKMLAQKDLLLPTKRLWSEHGLEEGGYAVATFHRPSNVDIAGHLQQIVRLLEVAAERLPVVFPVHPRSERALERHGLLIGGRVNLVPPLRYSEFISLLSYARVALTDSGGLQEETSILGIPCLTFRPNTERPETVTLGTNRLARPENAGLEIDRVLASPMPEPSVIPRWDGNAAPRVAAAIEAWLEQRAIA
ncbi:non-hydrolyzing UDP-N-acetylglucosamine 2-epimerase [Luteimonas suaedae]|uniref:non-hydrolyzing UDP-N-acetylglucosamine 2-epimerase n=1 Tax=Luteimonas suaedae TaxID=2605430 RepID=UPI00165A0E50|nr:UDP-N-acetylglucosamine 2-epimerase (non-hydrolyzing) [Luteimonas suaedae]